MFPVMLFLLVLNPINVYTIQSLPENYSLLNAMGLDGVRTHTGPFPPDIWWNMMFMINFVLASLLYQSMLTVLAMDEYEEEKPAVPEPGPDQG